MKLKDISSEELEEMSYADLTKVVLEEKGTKMKIVDVFKKICDAKGMSEAEFENTVADFFELISTDKNFVVLDKGFCDLRIKHNQTVVVDPDDEEDEVIEDEENIESSNDETEESNDEEDIFYDNSSDEDDVTDEDDDLADFMVVDEDEASM